MPRTLVLFLVMTGCGESGLTLDEGGLAEGDAVAELRRPRGSEDFAQTLDVMSWNVEWLGAVDEGPADEARQVETVGRILGHTAPELIGLVEVVTEASFQGVLTRLPQHRGLLVTDPLVVGGRAAYGSNEQKVALLFHERFTVTSARVVLTSSSRDFAGRPPMEVSLSFREGGRPRSLVVVVAHFKAMANLDGYTRRTNAARALKTWLDTEHPSRWALVVGDFNDDLDVSTYRSRPSPFAALRDDPGYRFTTQALTERGISTTLTFRSTIDHHLATRSLGARFVEGSAKVFETTALVPDAAQVTSDHLPVITRYDVR